MLKIGDIVKVKKPKGDNIHWVVLMDKTDGAIAKIIGIEGIEGRKRFFLEFFNVHRQIKDINFYYLEEWLTKVDEEVDEEMGNPKNTPDKSKKSATLSEAITKKRKTPISLPGSRRTGNLSNLWKEGDLVIAHSPSTDANFFPKWTKFMDRIHGKQGVVTKVDEKYIHARFVFFPENHKQVFTFLPSWLTKVEEEKSEEYLQDLELTKNFGVFCYFDEAELPFYQDIVYCFPSCLKICKHAFDPASDPPKLMLDKMSCVFTREVDENKKTAILEMIDKNKIK